MDKIITQLINYTNTMYNILESHSKSIDILLNLTQAVSKKALEASEIANNTYHIAVVTLGRIDQYINMLMKAQIDQLAIIDKLINASIFSILLGMWNFLIIIILIICIVRLNKKIKGLK